MIKFLANRCLKWIPTFIAILLCTFLLCINVTGNENIQEDELSASSASSTIIPSQLKQGLFYFVFPSSVVQSKPMNRLPIIILLAVKVTL